MLRKPRCHAYTLIEVLIMLSLVVILTLLAFPLFTQFLRNHRITAQTEALYAALQYARTEAVKSNTPIYVSFVTGDSWCYGINANSSCNCSVANSCTLLTASAPSAQQLTLSVSGLTSNSVNFETTHGAANQSGSITFTIYGSSELTTINIGRLGNLQICSTGISGYQGC